MKVEYNNLYTHFVLTTLNRLPVILEKNRGRIEKYMTGIVKNNDCRLYAIYANPEHVHFLISRSPGRDEESLATIIAESSARFINENKLCAGLFQWQQTCSAFSVSKKDVTMVCKYIETQKEHHSKQSYNDEYAEFLKHYQQTLNNKENEVNEV
jgi:REP element-mobilizing transposase RayT